MNGEIFFSDMNRYCSHQGKKIGGKRDEKLHLHRGGAEKPQRVDGGRRGRRLSEGSIRQNEASRPEADVRYGSIAQGKGGAEKSRPMAEKAAKIRVTITARRVRIDPEEKRSKYIGRLEELIAQLDAIIANSRTSQKLRLRAMDILRKTIDTCYGIVSDIEVEQLERELEEAKEEDKGEARDLGYEIEEAPG